MPITIDPTFPPDSQNPRQGAADVRALSLQLLQLLSQGGGGAVTFSSAPFSIDTSGNVTIPVSISVPAPTVSANAATKAYVDALGKVPGPNLTTTLVTTAFAAGSNHTIFTLSSTPPGTTALYRAIAYGTVYFKSSGLGIAEDIATMTVSLTDNATLFTTRTSAQNINPGNLANTSGISFSAVSNNTRTHNAGAVTFTVTGFAGSNSSVASTIVANADVDTNSKSYLAVTWIPAQ